MNVLVSIPPKIESELRQKAIHLSCTDGPDYGKAVLEIVKIYFQGQKKEKSL